jgi:mannose-6-phosphate isomerase-like protein (cupin superfamily)
MSYPEPRYFGQDGEPSAAFRPAGQEPDLRNRSGGSVHYLATGASTGGRFGLYRWEMVAAQDGPGPHFHRTIAESFFVLAGTVQLYDGTRWVDSRPGDFLYVPEGGIHGFRNASDEPASMLILFAPGAPREEYFETLARVRDGLVLGEAEKADLYRRHDNHWLPDR